MVSNAKLRGLWNNKVLWYMDERGGRGRAQRHLDGALLALVLSPLVLGEDAPDGEESVAGLDEIDSRLATQTMGVGHTTAKPASPDHSRSIP